MNMYKSDHQNPEINCLINKWQTRYAKLLILKHAILSAPNMQPSDTPEAINK
jgi:hypothetical protein